MYDVTTKKRSVPFECVDIRRETYTTLEFLDEAVIYDTWWLAANQYVAAHGLRKEDKELSAPSAGKTLFN